MTEIICTQCDTTYALTNRTVKLPYVCDSCVNFEYIKAAAKPSRFNDPVSQGTVDGYKESFETSLSVLNTAVESANAIIEDMKTKQQESSVLISDMAQQINRLTFELGQSNTRVTELTDIEDSLRSKLTGEYRINDALGDKLVKESVLRSKLAEDAQTWRGIANDTRMRISQTNEARRQMQEYARVWKDRALNAWNHPWTNLWNYIWE